MELSDRKLLEKLLDCELEEQCSLLELIWLQLELKLEELKEQQGIMLEHDSEVIEEELHWQLFEGEEQEKQQEMREEENDFELQDEDSEAKLEDL